MAFDFEKYTLTQQGQEVEIESFRVEFLTPWGTFSTMKSAIEKCKSLDMDCTIIIQPVIVIYDKAGRSETFMRGSNV